jgi:DNA-binding transcriptional LysR family regulator
LVSFLDLLHAVAVATPTVSSFLCKQVADLSEEGFLLRGRGQCGGSRRRRYGRPEHPRDLEQHACLIYANLATPELWRFRHATQGEYAVSVRRQLKCNNADAFAPALLAGQGFALQPEFMVWDDIVAGRLVEVLPDWESPEIALHLITLLSHLTESLAQQPCAHPLHDGSHD